jgi:poly-gamma-glutamate capsule biosynthesis protein CapA/YwtB (metallophosphatase superfamily)
LRGARLAHAGAGANLAEARKPAYLDTAAGRVALIAATTFYPPWMRAADQRPDALGRPGVNPLDFATSYTVDDASFAALAAMSEKLGLSPARRRQRAMFFSAQEAPEDSADALMFLGQRFSRGKNFSVATKAKAADLDANLRWIREAKRQADFVIFSLHNHEYGAAGGPTAATNVGMEEPASFVVEVAHAAIDAGADVVAGHGPHLTLGIEIYKDRPILYSLGNLIFRPRLISVSGSTRERRRRISSMRAPATRRAAFPRRPNTGTVSSPLAISAPASSRGSISIPSISATARHARNAAARCSPKARPRRQSWRA